MRVYFARSSHEMRDVIPPRLLNEWERTVIERVLSRPFRGRDEIYDCVNAARVSVDCEHCPSVWLQYEGTPISGGVLLEEGHMLLDIAPFELHGRDVDGMPITILLRVGNGRIYEVEAFRADLERFASLPDPHTLDILSTEEYHAQTSF